MSSKDTFKTEDTYMAPFFVKQPISIERGEGIYVWDEEGKQYMDFTSGWGVTCIGHSHPAILRALQEQGSKILQNPNSGLTYSPARARLLELMARILPENLTHVFFSNSGAEANDAVLKLARKVTGRMDVISTHQSFHGRTISTASATGQAKHREKYNPLMPNYRFVPYGDTEALAAVLDEEVAAFIFEPIQGEGGVRIPPRKYFPEVQKLCHRNGTLLIADEVQTGFCRTGPMFASSALGIQPDFLTLAKGIAGGFPFGAFAMSAEVAEAIELGDHGGTYCGNPLGCAVAEAVIRNLVEENISENVQRMETLALNTMRQWQAAHPRIIADVRGVGLLLMIEFIDAGTATAVSDLCLENRLFVRQTQGTGIRIFPALNITEDQMKLGLEILKSAIIAAIA